MTRPALRVLALAATAGLAAGLAVGLLYRGVLGPLAGWSTAGSIYLVIIWRAIWPMDAESTSGRAGIEDPSRGVTDGATLLAAVASLAAVGVLVAKSRSSHGSLQGIEIGIAVVSVVISWLVVHTLFTLHYARLYYQGDEGGVDFEKHVRPPYSDFAYLSFTIGMTFQVSDTDLQTAAFRRLALRHALLSYLFGAVILAATINLIAGLVH